MPAGAPMPGQELAFKLPREAAAACTSRLAGLHPSVALPSRLFQHGDPSHQQTEDYLADLLYRDPASFLERYGKHLTAEEVTSFVPLSHDYEVGFWVRSLQATHAATAVAATITTGQTQRSQVSAQARNRRLAAMQQLHDAGEFFSMEAMQERDPLLYQHYVGQYKDEDEELEEAEEKLSASLMRRYQQAQLQARIKQLQREQQEQEDEGPVSEHESDDEDETGAGAAAAAPSMQVDAPPAPAPAPALRGAAIRGIPSGGRKPVTAASAKPATAAATAAAAAAGTATAAAQGAVPLSSTSASTAAAGAGERPGPAASTSREGTASAQAVLSTQGQGRAPVTSSHVQRPPPAVRFKDDGKGQAASGRGGGIGSERQSQRQAAQEQREDRQRQFLQEMEARFLSGQDASFVDYSGIDANEQLDDFWLQQRGRDAEDAYFGEAGASGDDEQMQGGGRQRAGEGQGFGVQAEEAHGVQAMDVGDATELEEWERMAMEGARGRS